MTVWIALLRGVNVGGHRKIPMADLRAAAVDLGFENALTYVQSGNLIARSSESDRPRVETSLAGGIAQRFGFAVDVIARNIADWDAVIARNPFPQAADQLKTLHVFFLAGPAGADANDRLAALPRIDEEFVIDGDTLYLLTPSGIGRSKFAAAAERRVGVAATARNWNSVLKIAELAHALS